jgi:DNA-binding NtrC family response regulator
MTNEAVDPQAVRPPIQPRPALSLVGTPRQLSLSQFECFAGVSPNVIALKEFISVQATQSQPTLLIGERGLRQEQAARVLHQASEHWAQPFYSVNAHSLGGEALHTLLFGARGVIENCKRGTIFVNELTSLPALLQQRFAAHLEEQRWRARSGNLGAQRLIFATTWNPVEMRADNRIAFGLVEMLKSSSFVIKPLRERSEDIPYLAAQLLERIIKRLNKGPHEIAPSAMKVLLEYCWETNIEELEATLESAVSCTPPHHIDETLLPSRVRYATLKAIPTHGIDLPQMVDGYERGLIETALRQTNGNQTKAAQLLGLRVQTLNMKLKRFAEQNQEINIH